MIRIILSGEVQAGSNSLKSTHHILALLCIAFCTDALAVSSLPQIYCRKTDAKCLANCLKSGLRTRGENAIRCNTTSLSNDQLEGQLICKPERYLSSLTQVTVSGETDTRARLQWLYSWGQGDPPEDGKFHYDCSLDNRHELTRLHGLAHSDRKVRRSGWSIAESRSLCLADLLPMQGYTCTLWVQLGVRRSRPVVMRFSTKFGKPQLPVANLSARLHQSATSSTLQLRWSAGLQINLHPGYRVTVEQPFSATLVTQVPGVSLTLGTQVPGVSLTLGTHPLAAGFVNLSVVPFNRMGDGPAKIVEAALPPYQTEASFVEAGDSCQGRMVYWFNANSTVNGQQQATACFSQQVYRQCQTEQH